MKIGIRSNLRILMAVNQISSLKELGDKANVSWKILSNLDENLDIDTIQFGNIIKVSKALNTEINNLIQIEYIRDKKIDKNQINDIKSLISVKPEQSSCEITSNLRILMAINNIKNLRELERLSNANWKILSNLDKGINIETIQLKNLLKVSTALNCTLDELLNIQ